MLKKKKKGNMIIHDYPSHKYHTGYLWEIGQREK